MLRCRLSVSKSRQLFKSCNSLIRVKDCYANINRVCSKFLSKFTSGHWRVVYGYMLLTDNVYCRHAFILDNENNVLDPTLCGLDNFGPDVDYYVSYVFNDFNEYLNALLIDGEFSLSSYLRERDFSAMHWALENNLVFCG